LKKFDSFIASVPHASMGVHTDVTFARKHAIERESMLCFVLHHHY